MRVGFSFRSQEAWTAGLHYLRNLLAAVRSLDVADRPATSIVRRAERAQDSDQLAEFADDVVLEPEALFIERFLGRALDTVETKVSVPRPESRQSRWLRQHKVDVLFVPGEAPVGMRIPTIGWIPDFQHLHLPQFFSTEGTRVRNIVYSGIAKNAHAVVLSSRSAMADFERFAPLQAHKGRVLPFVAQVPSHIYETSPESVARQYHLPDRFVYLPNQFWAHKNHGVVVEALSKLRGTHPDVRVVCTGNTSDYRAPTYFGSLLATVSERGLRDQMVMLGLVPHDHVYQLMRRALAVLQPSLFEGWSTTVEEAKSLGKQLVLSDISVHREQAGPEGLFFVPHDADALAQRLIDVFDDARPGPYRTREAAARDALPARTRQFGQAFVNIAREVLAHRR